jgi:hypothetical protein
VLAVGRRFSRTPRHSFSEPPSKQVSLGGWANVSFLAWLAPRRILGYEPAGFFLADPVTRKQLTAPQLPGVVPTRLMRADKLAVLVHGPPVEIARRRPCRYRCPGESPERATRRHQGRDPLRLGVDARRELCARSCSRSGWPRIRRRRSRRACRRGRFKDVGRDPDFAGLADNTLVVGRGDDGLTAYSTDGDRLYHVLEGQNVGVVAALGSRLFVAQSGGPRAHRRRRQRSGNRVEIGRPTASAPALPLVVVTA